MSSLQGNLLVASPKLGDPNFFRAVVLLIRANDEGALGLILNRPSNTRLKAVWKDVSKIPCETEAVMYHGGPCPGPLMALHTEQPLAENEIMPQLYFATAKEKIEELVGKPETAVRFYAGYAGWSAGQLTMELNEGAWFSTQGTQEHAFWKNDDLWERLCHELASTTRLAGIKMKHEPPDPSVN